MPGTPAARTPVFAISMAVAAALLLRGPSAFLLSPTPTTAPDRSAAVAAAAASSPTRRAPSLFSSSSGAATAATLVLAAAAAACRKVPSRRRGGRGAVACEAFCAANASAAVSERPCFAGASRTLATVQRGAPMYMLMPKRIVWKKPHKPSVKPFRHCAKWKFKGYSQTGNKPIFGKYALQATEEAWITNKTIETVRRSIVRTMERKGKMWIRVFPHSAITQRVAESRMGAGKGGIEYWVQAIRPNFILFEMDGVTEDIARNAFRKASFRLPCMVRFLKKNDGPSLFELGLAGKPGRGGGGAARTVFDPKKGKKSKAAAPKAAPKKK